VVTLLGLITKHGILIVEFANQLQESGRSIHDAGGRGRGPAACARS
jgi:multidrug efflux pump